MRLLDVKDLSAHYGDFQALFGIDFHLMPGETVSVIGSNGAGKSTFLRTLTGLLSAPAPAVHFDGYDIGGMRPDFIVELGLAMVPEGRRLFPSLSVEDNLKIGAITRRPGYWNLERVYDLFPVLKDRRTNPGTALSGGQQQMVAVGRALMSNPKVLLCDEISLGLAPVVIKDIYNVFPQIMEEGTSIVVVEQDIGQAMKVSDRLYCFQEGRVALEGKPDALSRDQISQAYFGV